METGKLHLSIIHPLCVETQTTFQVIQLPYSIQKCSRTTLIYFPLRLTVTSRGVGKP